MDNNIKGFQKNKKRILIAEPDVKPAELFVSASPNSVERAIKESHEIDEVKLKKL